MILPDKRPQEAKLVNLTDYSPLIVVYEIAKIFVIL